MDGKGSFAPTRIVTQAMALIEKALLGDGLQTEVNESGSAKRHIDKMSSCCTGSLRTL